MKTLLSVLFSVAVVSTVIAQIPDPVPPAYGSWHDLRAAQVKIRLRQPPPPPAGGFWVVEDQMSANSQTIIRYYNDRRQELQTDTLTHKRLDLKDRAVVNRLNDRLASLLSRPVVATPVAYQRQ